MGKPLEIHVTDQQGFYPVMEHNLSPGTYPHICGIPGGSLQRTVPRVVYEDIWGPDVFSYPVFSFDLCNPSCVVQKLQPSVLNIQGKLLVLFLF